MSFFDDFTDPPEQNSWRYNYGPLYLIFSLESFSLGLWILTDPEETCAEFGFMFLTLGFIWKGKEKEDGTD